MSHQTNNTTSRTETGQKATVVAEPQTTAVCLNCGSHQLKDTGSFLVETHKCMDCGAIHCEDSADAFVN